MITLQETIHVPRSTLEAFHYVADFRNTREWDPTVTRAQDLEPGPLGVGSGFLVTCALPVGSINLQYEITRFEPGKVVELEGRCRWFTVTDQITFRKEKKGTRIEYRADFDFAAGINAIAPGFKAGFERMGKASVEGLRKALADEFPAPEPAGDAIPSRLQLLPELSLFSRRGYRRGSRQWHGMSASLVGRHIVITGVTTGIGRSTAEELARRGATLTLVGRDPQRMEEVVDTLIEQSGNDDIRAEIADLSLLSETAELAGRLLEQGRPIDVLINNAGALFNERAETAEGIERSLALLLLSPYLLTTRLKPLLEAAPSARVINVVSGGMYTQQLKLKQLTDDDPARYNGAVAYARAKRALMIATETWARQWADSGITVNAMHPGWADTPGVATSLPRFRQVTRRILRSPEEGADTIVWLAIATEAERLSGELFLDREPRPRYLSASTREADGEREALLDWLETFDFPEATIPALAAGA